MDKLKEENIVSKDSPMVNPLMATKIKIGRGNIFEGGVELETAGGEIIIGNFNVFENAVRIVNSSTTAAMVIDSNNYLESKTYIRDSSIGSYNVLKTYCMINGSVLKDCCVVAMCSSLHPGSLISPGNQLDNQQYSDSVGTIPNTISIQIPTGYKNSINVTYKRLYEIKIKVMKRRQAAASKPGQSSQSK